jgi:hypothetical protein
MQHLLYSSKSSEVLQYGIRHYFIIYIKFYFEKKEKKRWHSCFSGDRYLIIQIMTVCFEELVLAGRPFIVQRLALPGIWHRLYQYATLLLVQLRGITA